MLGFALAAKIESAASGLSGQDDWLRFCEANSIEELLGLVTQKQLFAELKKTASVRELENDLRELLYVELQRLSSFVHYPSKIFLNTMILRREMENLKDKIRDKHSNDPSAISDILSSVKDSIYFINLQAAVPNYETTRSCYFFETALDYTYWHFFRERMCVLSGADKTVASGFVGVEEDLHNVSWLFRAKFLFGLGTEEITSYVLPNGYLLSKEVLQNIAGVENKKEFVRLVSEYGYSDLFKREDVSSFSFFVATVRQRILKSQDLKKSSLGFLLWYFIQIQTQINMMIMLLESIDMKISVDMRKSVIKEVF